MCLTARDAPGDDVSAAVLAQIAKLLCRFHGTRLHCKRWAKIENRSFFIAKQGLTRGIAE